jgi:hypothetical protein
MPFSKAGIFSRVSLESGLLGSPDPDPEDADREAARDCPNQDGFGP